MSRFLCPIARVLSVCLIWPGAASATIDAHMPVPPGAIEHRFHAPAISGPTPSDARRDGAISSGPISPGPLSPGLECRTAIALAERAAGIPAHLMAAIAQVESGRYDPATRRTNPWPWTINAEGEPGVFATKLAALAAVRAKQSAGVQSIDIGCMQVNLLHHPLAFTSLEQAFDPAANAAYAARFLTQLYAQTGDWAAATARYHSAAPERGAAYQRKVAAVWPKEIAAASAATPPTPGSLFSAGQGIGFMPPGRSDGARIIPLPTAGGVTAPGRGLDAYRSAPISVVSRPRG